MQFPRRSVLDRTTAELLRLHQWLSHAACTHVAMESTSVYWKPVFKGLVRLAKKIVRRGSLSEPRARMLGNPRTAGSTR